MAKGNTRGRVVGEQAIPNPRSDTASLSDSPDIDPIDALQMCLDLVGLIPAAGDAADLLNAGISTFRGDFIGAGLSVIGMVPLIGQGVTAAKIAKNADRYMQAIKVVEQKVLPYLPKSLQNKLKSWLDQAKAKLDELIGKPPKNPDTPEPKPSGSKTEDGGQIKQKGKKKEEEKKAEQLEKNKEQGAKREDEVKAELEAEGHEVLGSQVTVKTPESNRRVDHLIRDGKTGKLRAIEVKSGNAKRTAAQIAKDNVMESQGAKIIGKNAPAELKNQIERIPTEVRN